MFAIGRLPMEECNREDAGTRLILRRCFGRQGHDGQQGQGKFRGSYEKIRLEIMKPRTEHWLRKRRSKVETVVTEQMNLGKRQSFRTLFIIGWFNHGLVCIALTGFLRNRNVSA